MKNRDFVAIKTQIMAGVLMHFTSTVVQNASRLAHKAYCHRQYSQTIAVIPWPSHWFDRLDLRKQSFTYKIWNLTLVNTN